ncbi:MAG: LysR family transcriptional regulator [Paracoccaceae bacterium]|nr:LysR family transcriptional regulator [Paracoccaceae bacterium]
MTSLRRSVPSLTALAGFEAAARLGSFTQAATELGVTQAAISRQIKLLEIDLNTLLFLREHRRVVLTSAGAALAGALTGAFTTITEMVETIRQPYTKNAVTVGATLAFSHFWILPRLPDFRAAHPEILLKLVADDSSTDLRRDRLDVAIRFGRPPFPDAQSVASRRDEAFPVCSPQLLAQHAMDAADADPGRLPLIASDIVNPSWLTWRSWAASAGLGPALGKASDLSRLRFNHYTDTIQAALNGEGVALGWAMLIASHLAEGRLVRVGSHSLILEDHYHVLIPAGRNPSPAALTFIDWITQRFQDEG